jgi:sulfate transport system ATP-binding protein
VFVTHDQDEALEVADRVVLMNRGVVEQVGTPQDVWEHPASPFVHGFLGDVNRFHGRAHEGRLHLHGASLETPEHVQAQDARAWAYVRPHELEVERWQPGSPGIVAELQRALVIGPVARLELWAEAPPPDVGAHEPLIEARIPAERFSALGLREGERLLLRPRRARVFLQQEAA